MAIANFDARPRRSVLYMPGSNVRALEKGRTVPADALILDLEDATAPDAKVQAREAVAAAVAAGGYGQREILIRVNGLDTPWGFDDLVAVAGTKADGVLLPKVEGSATVRKSVQILEAHDAHDKMRLWCMMETPVGILNATDVAGSHAKLGGFVMGTSDLAKDTHAAHTPLRLPMLTALSWCILAARAHGLSIIDGVFLDLNDDEGFADSCRQGLELGFDGKTLIHPKTVGVANEVFAPSAKEVEFSRRIIEAHAEAVKEGKGVVLLDGKLIENLHVENAHRLVTLADAIESMSAAAA